MSFDYRGVNIKQYAARLKVVDVFQPGNASGHVTDPRLYTAHQNPDGSWRVPPWKGGKHWIKHITAGTNSLGHLTGGSIAGGTWVCAHFLLPTDDYTVWKLIPDGHACNHVGPGQWGGDTWLNSDSYGVEVENPADGGRTPITPGQYIKSALICAYGTAIDHIRNWDVRDHGLVAAPFGRRSDPWAGGWDDGIFYGLLWEIRKPENWPWPIPLWNGQ